jgi:hypothetical protein
MVSEIHLFHCRVPKLLIKKRYYLLFLMLVFIVQVTKLVPFTQYNTFSKIPPSTPMHFETPVRTWHVAHLYSKIALSWKLFRIGHMYIYIFFCLEWLILRPFLLEYPVQHHLAVWELGPLLTLSSRLLRSLAQFLHFILWFILWCHK